VGEAVARSFWDRETKRWVPEEEYRGPVGKPAGPYVIGDLPDHVSPITKEVLGGRAARRRHMKEHKVVDMRDFPQTRTRAPKPLPDLDQTLKQAWAKVHGE
jgi:hypothetical protein